MPRDDDCALASNRGSHRYYSGHLRNKKIPAGADAFFVGHLEKNSSLIVEEIRRREYLLWDNYIEHKLGQENVSRCWPPSSMRHLFS